MAIPRHIFKDGGYYHDFQGIGDSCSLCNQTQEEIENQKRKMRKIMTAEQLAQRFHETYERLAPDFGYKTREASAKPWAEVPENNRNLMVAVCKEILEGENHGITPR